MFDAGLDLTSQAYERIEELFVAMQLAPGALLRTQDLQEMLGLGRTPVHQAVMRLAAETLLEIRPRNGLRIAPIDLARERRLTTVRRDLNRFVTEAAMRNMTPNDRARLLYLRRWLEENRRDISVEAFNEVDKSFDMLMIRASGERFLEQALRPLHAIARRIGYLHLTQISGKKGLQATIDRHLAIMHQIQKGDEAAACSASDDLITFSIAMIDEVGDSINPALFDTTLPTVRAVRPSASSASSTGTA
ncbi:GntR family transcriptional regulator [Chelativorans sp. AA-79]|uniref:GntR family transcriptional regulator n=1 Tax=Chelativorans sp. AA-79 TaxID=3028735 RepID=UPI0023F6DF6C|nr:GntR family transcriptional regulator [Chelativorans sp. AA-79]WEX10993.1 GntR family transcriptional regulator [Chelativorans sp. AA-79]